VDHIVRITPQGQAELSKAPGAEAFAIAQLNLPEGMAILLDAAAIAERAAETING